MDIKVQACGVEENNISPIAKGRVPNVRKYLKDNGTISIPLETNKDMQIEGDGR